MPVYCQSDCIMICKYIIYIYTCYTRLIGDVDFSHDIALLITF